MCDHRANCQFIHSTHGDSSNPKKSLAYLGYLETDGSYFWLASKVLRFSGSYLSSARLPRVVQPTLDRLAVQIQASFSVVVQDGDQVVIVARSSNDLRHAAQGRVQVLAYGLHLGARLPVHATSTGRVLLAGKTRGELAEWLKGRILPRLTAHTVTDARQLRALVDEARRQDFCRVSEEHELGVQALAVPLRNLQGQTVAALNGVVGPHSMSLEALQRDLLPVLLDAARELRPLL